DEQVKIRGYRIEPGEIEGVLREHGGVREAVVVAREDEPGEKRLVGYVVREGGVGQLGVRELRRHLQERLPEYMVPGAFVFLEAIPLTVNGKVDRRALPAPSGERPGEGQGYVGPRTPVEELLCGIWGNVLKVERVGIEDNFFDLGGHSLHLTQLAARIETSFNVRLALRTLFKALTVSEMALAISQKLIEQLSNEDVQS